MYDGEPARYWRSPPRTGKAPEARDTEVSGASARVVGGSRSGRGRDVNTGDLPGQTAVRPPAGVRAAIVAKKPGNAGGAKGGRKVYATEGTEHEGDPPTSRRRVGRREKRAGSPLKRNVSGASCDVRTALVRGAARGAAVPGWARTEPAPAAKSVRLRHGATRRLESRVREIRTHGSEGGAARQRAVPTPIDGDPAYATPSFSLRKSSIVNFRFPRIPHPASRIPHQRRPSHPLSG